MDKTLVFFLLCVVATVFCEPPTPQPLPSQVEGLRIETTEQHVTPLLTNNVTISCVFTGKELGTNSPLVSLVIYVWSATLNKYEEIAEIDSFGTKEVRTFKDVGAKVTGAIEPEEKAHIELSWAVSNGNIPGIYGCVANTLGSMGKTTSLTVSTTVLLKELDINALADYMYKVSERVKGLLTTVSVQKNTISTMTSTIGSLDSTLQAMNQTVAGLEGYQDVDTRLEQLDKRITELSGGLQTVKNFVDPLQVTVTSLQGDMAGLNASMASLDGAALAVQTSTQAMKADVDLTQKKVQAYERKAIDGVLKYKMLKRAVTLNVFDIKDGDQYIFSTKRYFDDINDAENACKFVNGKLWEATTEKMKSLAQNLKAGAVDEKGHWIGWIRDRSDLWKYRTQQSSDVKVPWTSADYDCARFDPYGEKGQEFINERCRTDKNSYPALCAV